MTLLCRGLWWRIHGLTRPNSECATATVDPKVNCGLWVTMSRRGRVPNRDDWDVSNGGAGEAERAKGNSVLSAHIFHKPKHAQKIKSVN